MAPLQSRRPGVFWLPSLRRERRCSGSGAREKGKIILAYEAPESSDQSLLLICDARSRHVFISYRDDRDRTRDGSRVMVEFASEGGRIALTMQAARQELDDILLLDTVTLPPELTRILSGHTLCIALSGVVERIPLDGARSDVAALVTACGTP